MNRQRYCGRDHFDSFDMMMRLLIRISLLFCSDRRNRLSIWDGKGNIFFFYGLLFVAVVDCITGLMQNLVMFRNLNRSVKSWKAYLLASYSLNQIWSWSHFGQVVVWDQRLDQLALEESNMLVTRSISDACCYLNDREANWPTVTCWQCR